MTRKFVKRSKFFTFAKICEDEFVKHLKIFSLAKICDDGIREVFQNFLASFAKICEEFLKSSKIFKL